MVLHLSSLLSPEDAFKLAMEQVGLFTEEAIICNGNLHRFYVEGDKRGSKNGFYILFGVEVPTGYFGCWKRGISKFWCALSPNTMTETQREVFKNRMHLARLAREREIEVQREVARMKALTIWESSAPVSRPL